MGKVVISQFITLDGVVEDPGGAEGFEHGGWAFRYERGDEGDSFKMDEVNAAEALLLGRVTYEGFAAAWPSREGPFADKFNNMPKHVVTSTLTEPEWNNSTVIAPADVAGAVTKLRDELDGDILVNGSVRLCQALAAEGLVDEYRLMLYPTLLGTGKKLFGELGEPASLKLAESRPAGETLILIYARG